MKRSSVFPRQLIPAHTINTPPPHALFEKLEGGRSLSLIFWYPVRTVRRNRVSSANRVLHQKTTLVTIILSAYLKLRPMTHLVRACRTSGFSQFISGWFWSALCTVHTEACTLVWATTFLAFVPGFSAQFTEACLVRSDKMADLPILTAPAPRLERESSSRQPFETCLSSLLQHESPNSE